MGHNHLIDEWYLGPSNIITHRHVSYERNETWRYVFADENGECYICREKLPATVLVYARISYPKLRIFANHLEYRQYEKIKAQAHANLYDSKRRLPTDGVR